MHKATTILRKVGCDEAMIAMVSFLLAKIQLKKNEDTQTLEDVICIVFLEHYLEPFSHEHPEDKIIDILQKIWRKMSEKVQKVALSLPFFKNSLELVSMAVKS